MKDYNPGQDYMLIQRLKEEIKSLKVENDINKADLQQHQIAANKMKKQKDGDILKLVSEKQKNTEDRIKSKDDKII